MCIQDADLSEPVEVELMLPEVFNTRPFFEHALKQLLSFNYGEEIDIKLPEVNDLTPPPNEGLAGLSVDATCNQIKLSDSETAQVVFRSKDLQRMSIGINYDEEIISKRFTLQVFDFVVMISDGQLGTHYTFKVLIQPEVIAESI